MPGRNDSTKKYRFGFNGQERSDDIKGVGKHNTALFWEYDTRLGRRLNLDPKPHPALSSYSVFGNNPIYYQDIKGDTVIFLLDRQGAGGNGHMGMLFQDKDKVWYYFSQGAAEGGSGSISGGVTGGVIIQPMLIKNESGEITKMTKQQAIDLLKTGKLDGSVYDETVQYNTSEEQDEMISNNAERAQRDFSSGKEKYKLITNNCVDACQDAVQGKNGSITGIPLPSDATTPKPNSYFEDLKSAASFFNGDIKPVVLPSKMDNIPAKTIFIPTEKNEK